MPITSIKREFNLFPNIVGIVTTDDLTAITTTDYFSTQLAAVELLNNGVWQWEPEDIVLIYYATALIGWFTYDATTDAFVALAANGGLSNTLPSGDIFVGNASNVATGVPMTGVIAITNAGVTSIVDGSIVNADINAAAAIAYSKLAALPSADILVGSAGNVATAVAMTGDIAISNTGVTSISAGVIVNSDINAAAAIDFSKLAALTSAHLLVGSAGNVATSVAVTGDVTISNAGVTAIGAGKVLLAMLGAGITPAAVIKFFGQYTTSGGSASEAITVTGAVAATDRAFVQVVDNGTNNTTVLQAVVTTDTLTVTFSADPGADAIINYQLIRAAS